MAIWKVWDTAEVPFPSVTRTWMPAETPVAVGTPAIAPVAGSSAIPAGSVPAARENAYGTLPPVAVKPAE